MGHRGKSQRQLIHGFACHAPQPIAGQLDKHNDACCAEGALARVPPALQWLALAVPLQMENHVEQERVLLAALRRLVDEPGSPTRAVEDLFEGTQHLVAFAFAFARVWLPSNGIEQKQCTCRTCMGA